MKTEIIPTVMPDDQEDFLEKIERVRHFVKTIQIDVMDGKFVPSKSWPYNDPENKFWNDLKNQDEGLPHWEDINYEVDLMVTDQIEEAKNWISAGVMRIIGHIEAFENQSGEIDDEKVKEFLNLKDEFGVEVSLALLPTTSLATIEPYLENLDSVQFMGINKIGFQGQPFEPKVLEMIKELRNKKPDLPISIDGGVNFDTAKDLVLAGANRLSSGSLVFDTVNSKETIEELDRLANK